MHIVYFSPTGGTRKAAYIIGKEIDPQATEIDITDHTRQQNSYELNGEDTLLVAVPVYGGRVPSVAIDRLKRITGHNTPAILVVVYGNRDYDDALLELKTTIESNGFQTVACIACIAEHSIMRVYAKGRPDSDDETILKNFSEQIKTKLVQLKNGESFTEIQVKGNADYKIYINSDKEPTEQLYSGNPLNDKLKEEIGSIPGIKEIQTLRKSATFTFEYQGYGGRGMCDMITKQNKKEIEDALIAGRMPENSREILVKSGYEDFGEEVKVGMQFEISLGREKIPVTVSGIFQSTKVASTKGSGQLGFNAAMMCMTEDAFKELLPGINNFDFTWVINIDPREESSVDENLRNTISQNEDIAIESFSERVNRYEKNNTIYLILQMISSLIFLFGVINLINTTLSNQLFRRREYSVLRSIGLTEKQLYKVIIGEGMCYSILSICMTLLIGTPIAMLICRQMSISCYGKVVEYSFPFFYMGIYVLVLLLIQVILSIYQIREQKKKSIIDQLRME